MGSPKLINWLLLVMLIGLWGTSFMFVSLALPGFSPIGIVAMRVLLAALVLFGVMKVRGDHLPAEPMQWCRFAIFGFMGNLLPFYLISVGQLSISSGMSGLMMAIMPLCTMVLAHYLIPGESLTRNKILGFLVGLSGVFIILSPHLSLENSRLFGALLVLMAAVSYAVNSILVKRAPTPDPVVAGAGMMILASLFVVPIWLWQAQPWLAEYDTQSLAAIIWLGIGPTGIASVIYFTVINRAGPTFLSNINYFIPVVAYFAGAMLLGEPLHVWDMLGLMLIIGGIRLTQVRRVVPMNG